MKTVTLLGIITVAVMLVLAFIMIRKQNNTITALINKAHPSLSNDVIDNGDGTVQVGTDTDGEPVLVGRV